MTLSPQKLGAALLVLFGWLALTIHAQDTCGIVDGISYPIDPNAFMLAQDYAVPSMRHQGRYHTGEDWYGGLGLTLGQPVRAAARGRVTFSAPTGWGTDGGVVIIEHTFPDGSIYYTQYGHMLPTDIYPFPERWSCVEQGDVIGTVGDARPAPHLHFEVRFPNGINGTAPGPGYTRAAPYDEGYRDPEKFILNQQAWLSVWHAWHLLIGQEGAADERGPSTPPLLLNDNSLLYLNGDGTILRRATPDGRILWRALLERRAVALDGWRGLSLLIYADGTMQQINVETGGLSESWQVDAAFADAPIVDGERLLFPTLDGGLQLVDEDRRTLLGTIPNVPDFRRAQPLPDGSLALLTQENRLLFLSAAGEVIDEAQLQAAASLGVSPEGRLLVYSQGGFWQVDSSGEWSLYIEGAAPGGASSGLLVTEDRTYAFNQQRLYAYDHSKNLIWDATMPPLTGLVEMQQYDDVLLLTSNHGHIVLASAEGRFCNQTRIYGNDDANQWHELGSDGIMRFAVADQHLGLNWELFTRPCRS